MDENERKKYSVLELTINNCDKIPSIIDDESFWTFVEKCDNFVRDHHKSVGDGKKDEKKGYHKPDNSDLAERQKFEKVRPATNDNFLDLSDEFSRVLYYHALKESSVEETQIYLQDERGDKGTGNKELVGVISHYYSTIFMSKNFFNERLPSSLPISGYAPSKGMGISSRLKSILADYFKDPRIKGYELKLGTDSEIKTDLKGHEGPTRF